LFEARLGTEVYATRLAARRVAEGACPDRLTEMLRLSEDAHSTGDSAAIAEASSRFHDEIMALARNTLLADMLQIVSGRDRWVFELTAKFDQERACAEHKALHEAIVRGNAELAEAIAYSHIEHGRQESLDSLRAVLPLE
jgi:DNA-binding GntR family transcriptional regulator